MTAIHSPIPVEEAPEGAEVLFRPFPGFQERALRASADEVLLGGAKGPGKTLLLLTIPLRWAHKELMAIGIVRESVKQLQRVMDEAHRLYGKLPTATRPAWNGTLKRFTWPSGGFAQFGYAGKVSDMAWTQGGNWSHFLYDEIGNLADERVVNTLQSEIRCKDPTIRRQLVGSANPGFAGTPWIKRRFIVPCGKQGERIAWARVTLEDGRSVWRSRQFVPGRITDNPILMNDMNYMAALALLPERMKKCLLYGDWDAASGIAIDELDPAVHLVPRFTPPEHWPYIAGFDWGFAHWAVFIWGRVSDDGRIYICDVIKRRLLRDWDLAGTFLELVPDPALRNVQAGHDCWSEQKARGDNAPQTAEYFLSQGIQLTQANIARVQGFNNLLQYFAWRESEFLPARQPMIQFMDTPGCRWLVEEHLPTMVMDPDDPRDVLKIDADSDTGEGGDDGYDCLRYLLASRPLKAPSLAQLLHRTATDPDVLRREAAKFGRVETKKLRKPPIYTGD
jgi:hypothetical protein